MNVNLAMSYNPYNSDPQAKLYSEAVSIIKSKKKPIAPKEYLNELRSKVPDVKPDYLYYRVILESSKDPKSPIQSKGRGRASGYFYEEIASADVATCKAHDAEAVQDEKGEKRKYDQTESRLWRPVARWLLTNKKPKYVSAEVANKKKGGIWGNPDVIGLAPLDRLGFFDIEVTSIEVKPSLQRWEYYFFEAVSHKRFAERSYFAFYEEEIHKYEIDDLLSYAEKYGVGLLQIDIPSDQFVRIADWSAIPGNERDEIIELFKEIYPAPYSDVELGLKCDYLENLGITQREHIYNFGLDEDV